ncbi:MAG: 50S ribosomal protein L6 [Pirellulaceae bacterium]|jgi:large subunit ribosomal protein L6|nr:50S ribosomal protein L6 [Pirellulaceae bacterium]
MSRIGKKPVEIPAGIQVAVNERVFSVEGPQGKLQFEHRPEVSVEIDEENKQVVVTRKSDEREARAFHGLTRSLIQNMVIGVKDGYEKKLEIVGVGYLGQVSGDSLSLRVGFANEIQKKIPAGLDVSCPDQTHIVVKGCDKQQVGQFAAEVRAVRKPEPYKGKGIRYEGEHVKLKPGKAAV